MINRDSEILMLSNRDIQKIINANNKKDIIVKVDTNIIPSLKTIDHFLRAHKLNNCNKELITKMSDSAIVSDIYIPNFLNVCPAFSKADFVIRYKEQNYLIAYKGLDNLGSLPKNQYIIPDNITYTNKIFVDDYYRQVNEIMSDDSYTELKISDIMPTRFKDITLNSDLIPILDLFKTIFGFTLNKSCTKFITIYYLKSKKFGTSPQCKFKFCPFSRLLSFNKDFDYSIKLQHISFNNIKISIYINNVILVSYDWIDFTMLKLSTPTLINEFEN